MKNGLICIALLMPFLCSCTCGSCFKKEEVRPEPSENKPDTPVTAPVVVRRVSERYSRKNYHLSAKEFALRRVLTSKLPIVEGDSNPRSFEGFTYVALPWKEFRETGSLAKEPGTSFLKAMSAPMKAQKILTFADPFLIMAMSGGDLSVDKLLRDLSEGNLDEVQAAFGVPVLDDTVAKQPLEIRKIPDLKAFTFPFDKKLLSKEGTDNLKKVLDSFVDKIRTRGFTPQDYFWLVARRLEHQDIGVSELVAVVPVVPSSPVQKHTENAP